MLPTQRSKVLTTKPFAPPNWRTATVAMLLVAVMTAVLFPASGALADDADSTGESDGTGIKVGAWAATVPYIIAKGTFAACGAVVGGLGYVFSGLDDRVAKAVWTRSIYGTYIIRPAHLRGEEAVRFLGEEPERRDDSIAPLDQAPPPESVAP
jgi:hypothetical protein